MLVWTTWRDQASSACWDKEVSMTSLRVFNPEVVGAHAHSNVRAQVASAVTDCTHSHVGNACRHLRVVARRYYTSHIPYAFDTVEGMPPSLNKEKP